MQMVDSTMYDSTKPSPVDRLRGRRSSRSAWREVELVEGVEQEESGAASFDGEFKPPMMGNVHMPLPVAGPGRVVVQPDGLVVEGFSTFRKSCLMVLLFFAGFVGLIAVGVLFDLGEWAREVVVYAGLAGFAAVALKGRGNSYREDDPVHLEIPWEHIRKVEHSGADKTELREMAGEADGKVKILVKDFDPRGMIHFLPVGRSAELARRIRAAAELE